MGAALPRTADDMSDHHEPVAFATDDKTRARMAAEKVRQQIVDLGLTPAQVSAVLETMRLVLINENERAEAALQSKFPQSAVDRIFPAIVAGLSNAA